MPRPRRRAAALAARAALRVAAGLAAAGAARFRTAGNTPSLPGRLTLLAQGAGHRAPRRRPPDPPEGSRGSLARPPSGSACQGPIASADRSCRSARPVTSDVLGSHRFGGDGRHAPVQRVDHPSDGGRVSRETAALPPQARRTLGAIGNHRHPVFDPHDPHIIRGRQRPIVSTHARERVPCGPEWGPTAGVRTARGNRVRRGSAHPRLVRTATTQ